MDKKKYIIIAIVFFVGIAVGYIGRTGTASIREQELVKLFDTQLAQLGAEHERIADYNKQLQTERTRLEESLSSAEEYNKRLAESLSRARNNYRKLEEQIDGIERVRDENSAIIEVAGQRVSESQSIIQQLITDIQRVQAGSSE